MLTNLNNQVLNLSRQSEKSLKNLVVFVRATNLIFPPFRPRY